MELNIWWALLFICIGSVVTEFYNMRAWRKYYEGKNESKHERDTRYR